MRKRVLIPCVLIVAACSIYLYSLQSDRRQANIRQIDIQELHKIAERGDAKAEFLLGEYCHVGVGVEKDFAEAVKWYRKAAEQWYAPAQYELGKCYEKGEGVEQDYIEAFKWFHEAAEQGYIPALNYLDYYAKEKLNSP